MSHSTHPLCWLCDKPIKPGSGCVKVVVANGVGALGRSLARLHKGCWVKADALVKRAKTTGEKEQKG